ncbi:hypothetical protein M4D55_23535 [Metabacillus idriensis]|uniref:hypothetical protein n=1 Tax=Metabacillus idriensis TaxID=324768 RepID=UPI00203B5935|nr:hypothetical protein [Metabacillus idriensis]MCM3598736.1 hypothetical protein [Metabacillus idriensis]
MAKMQSMSIGEFMSGDYKTKKKRNKSLRLAATSLFPLTLFPAMASANGPTVQVSAYPEAIPVGASEWMSEKALETLAHALDPLVDLMVALSFPIASVIIIGGCFFFMLGKPERAWSSIQNAGLGYVLIQIMPLLLNVLKEVGGSI